MVPVITSPKKLRSDESWGNIASHGAVQGQPGLEAQLLRGRQSATVEVPVQHHLWSRRLSGDRRGRNSQSEMVGCQE